MEPSLPLDFKLRGEVDRKMVSFIGHKLIHNLYPITDPDWI
jgi:hypothetical protein